MRPPTTTASRVLPVLLPAIVVALVLGILGMHALATHGVMTTAAHHPDAAHGTTATSTGVGTPELSELPGLSALSGTYAGPGQVDSEHEMSALGGAGGHSMGGMVMLCVAMLAAAGLLISLALALRRTPRLWARLPAVPTRLHRFAFPRRATGPPAVWEFSVIRC